MFRMKFLSRDTADEDDDSSADGKNGSVQEQYKERSADSVGCSSEAASAVVFEGRVGKFGRIRRLSNSNNATQPAAHHDSSLRSLILSPNVATTGSKNCADVDLSNFEAGPAQDAEVRPHYAAIIFDVDVLKELVKPFAESLHVKIQGSTKGNLADKKIVVTYIHYQTSVKRQEVESMGSVSSQAPALLEARTESMRSASSDADSECCSNYMDEGKPTCDEGNEAVTGMINKLMQKRKNNQPNVHDDRLGKPWEEPLLAAHDQAKLNLMARKEAKIEAKRLAEEEQRNRERQQRELRDLASCVSTAPTPGGSFKKRRKLKKILRSLKYPLRLFRSQKIKHGGYPIAQEAKVMTPKARLFSGPRTVPSGPTDPTLASMRNASQQQNITRSHIQFAKVDSTQRDVPAWTTEEYLRKNGRIPEQSNDTEDNEEFGGVLGNNYLNQYLDDGMTGGVVSDYDSDSD